MSSTTEQSTLASVIDAAVRAKMMGLHTGLIGRVLAFYPARGTVDVQPLPTLLDERGTARVFPVLQDVPFVFPRAGTLRVTWPLNEGDFVWLVFGERDLTEYLTGGQEVTASTVRTPLGSAVAMPGPWPLNDATTQAGGMKVEYKGVRIEITTGGYVQIDAGAGKVALGNDYGEALAQVSEALGYVVSALNATAGSTVAAMAGTSSLPLSGAATIGAAASSVDAAKSLLDNIRGPLT